MMMEPACEVNENDIRGNTDWNELLEEGSNLPLELDPNEVIEANEENLPYAEEDWQGANQIEVPDNFKTDLPFVIQTRQGDRKKFTKK